MIHLFPIDQSMPPPVSIEHRAKEFEAHGTELSRLVWRLPIDLSVLALGTCYLMAIMQVRLHVLEHALREEKKQADREKRPMGWRGVGQHFDTMADEMWRSADGKRAQITWEDFCKEDFAKKVEATYADLKRALSERTLRGWASIP
ncbi:MAG: hypothetical protein ACRDLB_08630 [Actinomycetota bacterium]